MSDNSLVRRNLESSLQSSSLKSLIEDTLGVTMLLIDTSGSMASPIRNADGIIGERAVDALRKVVTDIKSTGGGWPMIAFGGPYDAQVRFVDDVPEPDGGTPLHMALELARQYGATRVVVISDGMPMLPEQCISEGKALGRVDVVFVGDARDSGRAFLQRLASETGGQEFMGDLSEIKLLAVKIIGLLVGEVPEPVVRQGEGFSSTESEEETDEDIDDEDADEEDDDEDGE